LAFFETNKIKIST